MPCNAEKVRDIFNDYYGEEKVDFVPNHDDYDIIVWFPVTTITNEYGESTVARDIFVKLTIKSDGRLKVLPKMARATFTDKEVSSGYIHSHCSGFHPRVPNEYFSLCFGTGPINSTFSSLLQNSDEALWTLLCGELDLYVKTESIAGVPYRRLSNIGASRRYTFNLWCEMSPSGLKNGLSSHKTQFFRWFLVNYTVPVTYNCGRYIIAMSDTEFLLLVSEAVSKFCDETGSYIWATTREAILKGDKLYLTGDNSTAVGVNSSIYIDFKGRRVPLTVTESSSDEDGTTVCICTDNVVQEVYSLINQLLVYKYGKESEQA